MSNYSSNATENALKAMGEAEKTVSTLRDIHKAAGTEETAKLLAAAEETATAIRELFWDAVGKEVLSRMDDRSEK